MAILTVGRVGLDVVLGHPSEWSEERTLDGGRALILRGWLMAASQAETKALRSELIDQIGQLVAVTYSLDSNLDAFYVPTDVRIESVLSSYRGGGAYRFEISLIRIGSDSRTELQSLITGAGVDNVHGLSGDLWWAAPPGALAISTGDTVVTEHQRSSEDGEMGVFIGVTTDNDPTWSITPANYYDSAVKVYSSGRLRAGQDIRNDPANWELSNGILRLRPVTFGGTSNGRWDVNFHNGTTWGTDITFKLKWNDSTDIPEWHYMSIVRNTPELSVVRLVRDAETAPPSADRHVLDFCLRRGAPFVSCHYTYTGVVGNHAAARDSSDAANTGAGGYIYDTGTIGGHRWILGTPEAYVGDTTNGKIAISVDAQTFPFYIGAAIDDAADASNDGPADIAEQYIGWMSETVRAIRR